MVNESGTRQVSLSGVFADADEDALTITAKSSDTAVAAVSVSADYASLTVTAAKAGTATVTVTADDGNGGTVSDAFTVKVKAAPTVASAIADVNALAVGATHEVSLSGVFADADGDALTIAAESSDTAVATVSTALDGTTGAVTGISVTGKGAGTATVTVTARDADGNSVSDAFEVTVPAPPQDTGPPVAGQLEPYNIRVTPGDGTLTVTWSAAPREGVSNERIWHALRWSQTTGLWANPTDHRAGGPEDGIALEPGTTTYTITGLTNGTATGVFVRSFTGSSYSEHNKHSSQWVRTKGENTTPKAAK
jgi:hypothetical protein